MKGQEAYNDSLSSALDGVGDYDKLVEALRGAAEGNIPVEVRTAKGEQVSEDTLAQLAEMGRLRKVILTGMRS